MSPLTPSPGLLLSAGMNSGHYPESVYLASLDSPQLSITNFPQDPHRLFQFHHSLPSNNLPVDHSLGVVPVEHTAATGPAALFPAQDNWHLYQAVSI